MAGGGLAGQNHTILMIQTTNTPLISRSALALGLPGPQNAAIIGIDVVLGYQFS